MSTNTPPAEAPPRIRDAERSKRALLAAGTELFAEKGYSRARLRDIAGRAGVDAALVIRYFGSKEGLYLAALKQDEIGELPLARTLSGPTPEALVDALVDRAMTAWDNVGVGPLALALSRPDAGDDTRAEVRARLEPVLAPLAEAAAAAGKADPRMRAEAAVSALVGIGTVRSLGSLDALTHTERAAVEPVLRAVLRAALLS